MRRFVRRAAVAIAVALILTILGLVFYLRSSLPVVEGTVVVEGPSAPIEIVRDRDAIPHVLAASRRDAFFGLGYVHAQDRLWQMEFQRRIAHGRLSEMFGAVAVPQDRFLRTLGTGRASVDAWRNLEEHTRLDVEAYIAGINAFLAGASGRLLPPEFTLLGITPEPWTGPDVIGWIKMMAWDLSENYDFELLRDDLRGRVGVERAAALMPPYPDDGLSIVHGPLTPGPIGPGLRSATAETSTSAETESLSNLFADALSLGHPAVRDVLLRSRVEGIGSNNWVLGGTRTASGQPLLANDPHLGTRIPSTWYLAHIKGGDLDVIGATLPGVPGVASGRNRRIAWGVTNVGADVQDLYRERLNPEGTAAMFNGVFEPLTVVTETIRVRDAEPITLQVRISRHGPLISDAINANLNGNTGGPLEPLAFRWTALGHEDATLPAFMAVNVANNWSEFTKALEELVVPAQNFVYADVDGHIGYYAPGRIPIRARGDGSSPAEGWTGDMEWTGFIPFEELPHAFDPPEGFIVTANHRPMPAGYPHLIALEYPEPYRASRITALIEARERATANDMRDIQADTWSGHAAALLPLMLSSVARDRDDDLKNAPREQHAIERLKAWDLTMDGDEDAAAIFEAWFFALIAQIAGDDLGQPLFTRYEGLYSYVSRFLTAVLESNDGSWCDRTETDARESCGMAVSEALRTALSDLESRLGAPDRWRWDAIHIAVFPHQALDTVGLLRPFVSRRVPGVGDFSTVNVGPSSVEQRYEQRSVAGYRQIVDFGPESGSRFLDAVGQSGHPLSRHYDDGLSDWRAVQHRPMRMERSAIDDGAIGRLVLQPR